MRGDMDREPSRRMLNPFVLRCSFRYDARMIDHRFPTALQIMQTLVHADAFGSNKFISSARFATFIGTNPTLIRKLLLDLVQHGLVGSQMGRAGGVRLARSPDEITLQHIASAVTSKKRLWTARADLPPVCYVSSNFADYFEGLASAADEVVAGFLASKTLTQSYLELRHAARARKTALSDDLWIERVGASAA